MKDHTNIEKLSSCTPERDLNQVKGIANVLVSDFLSRKQEIRRSAAAEIINITFIIGQTSLLFVFTPRSNKLRQTRT